MVTILWRQCPHDSHTCTSRVCLEDMPTRQAERPCGECTATTIEVEDRPGTFRGQSITQPSGITYDFGC